MNRRAVGIIANERHILAWNYLDGNDIRVSADRIGLVRDEDGAMRWHISLQTCNGTILEGVASCGKWCCDYLVRGLRNAMTGRKNKMRNTHRKYQARKAAAAEAAAGAAPVEQQAYDNKAAEPVADKPAEPIAPEEEGEVKE
jgi:hypothetical protein